MLVPVHPCRQLPPVRAFERKVAVVKLQEFGLRRKQCHTTSDEPLAKSQESKKAAGGLIPLHRDGGGGGGGGGGDDDDDGGGLRLGSQKDGRE